MSPVPASGYSPPTAQAMLTRQDDMFALRLLLAQRKLYGVAKCWVAVRWFGMLVIGLAAPLLSVLNPNLAVWAGAAAGLWIFLGRTCIVLAQQSNAAKAAAVQEQFDFYVFAMPRGVDRSTLPLAEEISRLAGNDDQIEALAAREKLFAWYPIRTRDTGIVAVAIAQRANAAYSDRLLRTTAVVWAAVTTAWVILLIVASVVSGLTLMEFMCGILLPVLPAFLDVVEFVTSIWRSSGDRKDLARAIEERLRSSDGPETSELLEWQARLYDMRRSTPAVPDAIYKITRNKNESAMHSAARQLSDSAGSDQ